MGDVEAGWEKQEEDLSLHGSLQLGIASPCYRFKRILVLISHSQDFLNGVCTNIIHMHNRKLKYYTVSRRRLLGPVG